ncbi:hypothetical protein RYH80_03290 [Halobaculum sp. MBLA0147]|uniref:hypothetical protein n=1 Tax=Halobaculum sp. MBLA0147 TaxID=3079934 RepID=UPI0035267628
MTEPVVYAGSLHDADCPMLDGAGGRQVPVDEFEEWDRPGTPGNRNRYRDDCQWCSVDR